MIVGDPKQFAIEFRLHPDCSSEMATAVGAFHYWIDGSAFGRNDDDAVYISTVYRLLVGRIRWRGSFIDAVLQHATPRDVLATCYEFTHNRNQQEFSSFDEYAWTVSRYSSLLLAPNGEESDFSEIVAQLDVGNEVRVVGGWTVDTGSAISVTGPYADLRMAANDFYGTIRSWLVQAHRIVNPRRRT